jgi:hypothetical protein
MTDEGTPQEYAKGYAHGYDDGKAAAIAATPAPLDVLRAWIADQPKYDTEMRSSTRARQKWQREHDAWLRRGPSAARAALAATPAPLDERQAEEIAAGATLDAERVRYAALVAAARDWLAQQPHYNPNARNTTLERRRLERETDAWLRRGPNALRAALDEVTP